MSCSCDSDSESMPGLPTTSKSSLGGRSGRSIRHKDSFMVEDKANVNGTPAGDNSQIQNSRGTRLKVQRFDEVFDPESNKFVVREVDQGQVQEDKVTDSSNENVFNVLRKIFPNPYSPSIPPKVVTYLDIKSGHLRDIGRQIIGGYTGISWTVEPLRVAPKAFIAYLPQLQMLVDKMKSEQVNQDGLTKLEHLEFLISFIKDEYRDLVSEISSYLQHGEITFEHLWAIMLHHVPLYTTCTVSSQPRILWVNGTRNVEIEGRPACIVEAQGIDYNAQFHSEDSGQQEKFGFSEVNVPLIWEFKGAVKINQLAAFPLEYHPDLPKLREQLLSRGKKWANLQGVHHKYYTGNAYYRTSKGCMAKHYVNSRIMIDWKALEEIEPNFRLPQTTGRLEAAQELALRNTDSEHGKNPLDTPFVYTSPLVYGFSLTDKRWFMFDINLVKDFEWSEEPINNLVLPSGTKELIKALVEKHSGHTPTFDDFIQGKGQGLIINLFGKPGVGKTLTVEATSEHVKKPLYVVGSGDLGTTARELDMELTRIFSAATKWGAVVLIDEADVFLEKRSLHDLHRNAMVAVFLRQLEYYRGILFLTTNRVRSFDDAFQSRIHLSLRFHDLDSGAKRQIWLAFINKSHRNSGLEPSPNAGLSDADLKRLAEKEINGRQIKNVVGTAAALAEKSDEVLGYKHIVGVLEILDQFGLDFDSLTE